MGMDWAYALSQGLGAAAQTGAGIIDQQMQQQRQMDAEERAANRQLDTAQRMMAIQDAMKMRAAERFSATVKDKMGEQIPVDPESVAKSGITQESGKAIGLPNGLNADPKRIKQLTEQAQAALENPNATDQQREDARALMDQITQQLAAQTDINAKGAEGKTRTRTLDEATEAALADTLQNDPAAYLAGAGMLKDGNKRDLEEKKLESKERIATAERERKERADNLRFEAMMARIEAAAGGKNAHTSALIQNLEYLKNNMGWTADQLNDYVTEKKHIAPEDIAVKLLASDKMNDLTPETAMEKAMSLVQARDKLKDGRGGGAAVKALPAGAKKIGTSGGKPVYETPDGKRFIQD